MPGAVIWHVLEGELPQFWESYCHEERAPGLAPRGLAHVRSLQQVPRPLLRCGHGENRTGRVLPESRVGAEPGRGSPRHLPQDVLPPARPSSAESFTRVEPVPVPPSHPGSEWAVTWLLLLDAKRLPVESTLHL